MVMIKLAKSLENQIVCYNFALWSGLKYNFDKKSLGRNKNVNSQLILVQFNPDKDSLKYKKG